jgi:hypothetical protein
MIRFPLPPEHSPSPLMRIYQHWIKTVSALKSLITNQKMVTIAVALSKMLHAITLISASLIRCRGLFDGPNTGTQTGSSIFLQYVTPLNVSDLLALADTNTIFRDGDKFIGSSLNKAMLDLLFGDDRLDSIQLNDILTDNIPQPDLAIISGEQDSFLKMCAMTPVKPCTQRPPIFFRIVTCAIP